MTPTQTCPTCRVVLMDGTEALVKASENDDRMPLLFSDFDENVFYFLEVSGDLIMSHAIARIIKE